MSASVTVIDYGMGNLYSVCRAFEHLGADVLLTDRPQDVLVANCLVLPGVGAFKHGMAELETRGLVPALQAYARKNRPVLGICLGMQMLLDHSEEFGTHRGLGIIPGAVRAIPKTGANGAPHKIPHIGWNRLIAPAHASWKDTLLDDMSEGVEVYFVHSYTAEPESESVRLADSDYDGRRISAIVRKGNVYGCQFHPEKSGTVGLQMLRNFLSITTAFESSQPAPPETQDLG